MSRIWKELRKRVCFGSNDQIFNPMWGGGPPADISPDPKLIPEGVYCVHVCGFTFKFWSVDQIKAALDFYSQKIHPTSRIYEEDEAFLRVHRYVVQRGYERLPLYLRKEGKRQRVVKALEQALKQFSNEKPLMKKTIKASDLPVISPHAIAHRHKLCGRSGNPISTSAQYLCYLERLPTAQALLIALIFHLTSSVGLCFKIICHGGV